MKKAFQIFGLALIASSLIFTACKKDEEKGTTNNTDSKVTAQNLLKVDFNGTSYKDFGYMSSSYQEVEDTALFTQIASADKTAAGYALPYFYAVISLDAEKGTRVYSVQYGNDYDEMIKCIDSNEVYNPKRALRGNWYAIDALNGNTVNVLDPTNVIISYKIGAVMINVVEYEVDDKEKDDCTQKNLYAEGTAVKFEKL